MVWSGDISQPHRGYRNVIPWPTRPAPPITDSYELRLKDTTRSRAPAHACMGRIQTRLEQGEATKEQLAVSAACSPRTVETYLTEFRIQKLLIIRTEPSRVPGVRPTYFYRIEVP